MASEKKKFNGRLISGGIVAVIALLIVIQNTNNATINFLSWSWSMPLWLILVIMFLLGMLLGGVVRTGVRKLRGSTPKKT
jgi:lipopolysaccharide assembly protein A